MSMQPLTRNAEGDRAVCKDRKNTISDDEFGHDNSTRRFASDGAKQSTVSRLINCQLGGWAKNRAPYNTVLNLGSGRFCRDLQTYSYS